MTDAPQNPEEGSTDSTESVEQTQARLAAEGGAAATSEVASVSPPETAVVTYEQAAPQPEPEAAPQATPGAASHSGESFRKPRRVAPVGVVAAIVAAALVGGVSGAGVTLWASSNSATSPVVADANPTSITVNNTKSVTQVTAVAAKASPSVVTINVAATNSGGTGSGVVLTKDGYILTNTHVVTLDGATADGTITVTTNDGRLLKAKVVGTDPISDLAVIKVDDVSDLQPADFADSAKLNVGDTAIAIGAPLGLAGTVTDGIVSALNRSITIASSAVPKEADPEQPAPQGPDNLFNFDIPGQQQAPTNSASSTISLAVIQTDAAINPGNSGGALLNSDGQVIGINVAIASAGNSSGSGQSGSIGVGFAIPANLAQRIAKEIMDTGTATHGLLGASVADVTEDKAQADSEVVGASIVEISQGGAAGAAGLKVGDIITKFDGIPITGKTDLTAQVRALAAGASATVTYVRDGKAAETSVTLGELK